MSLYCVDQASVTRAPTQCAAAVTYHRQTCPSEEWAGEESKRSGGRSGGRRRTAIGRHARPGGHQHYTTRTPTQVKSHSKVEYVGGGLHICLPGGWHWLHACMSLAGPRPAPAPHLGSAPPSSENAFSQPPSIFSNLFSFHSVKLPIFLGRSFFTEALPCH